MRTKNGRELANLLNIIFIELPKTKNLEESLETNSALENWAIFLKEADNPQKRDVINRLTKKEVGLMQAQKSLSSISADRDLWIAQYRQEIADRDRRSGLNAAINKGLAQGIEQGIKQSKYDTARQMLSDNVPVSQIAKWTGLSVSEIEGLDK
jgi:predicted transposase/invertase (TIGR01784 family)